MSGRKRRNAIADAFIAHAREMRESPAWMALPNDARRALDRLELEHMRHGGADNGALPVTYTDFVRHGIRRAGVALALRQCVALGFLEITRKGHMARSDFRTPSLYRLTYVFGAGKSHAPTHEWRRIATMEEAEAALTSAAATKNFETQPRRNLAA